jgi:diguanylate cyclase (GGDEF)-like protein
MPHALLDELKKRDKLPSAPGVALRILELNRRDDVKLDELAQVLSQDPALVAKVIKTANSSAFGVAREISNLRQAVMLLGQRSVNLLALSFSLTGKVAGQSNAAFDYRRFWTQAIATALAARIIASRTERALADECFLGGLLCDLGQLILAEAVPDRYSPVLGAWKGGGRELCALEEESLELSHMDVGGDVLASWGLPVDVCNAIGAHHAPERLEAQQGKAVRIARVLGLASTIAELLSGGALEAGVETLRADGARYLDLTPEACGEILQEVQEKLPEMATLLSVEIQTSDQLIEIRTQAMELLVRESMALNDQVREVTSQVQKLEAQKEDLELRATTDPLTGLRNRGFFDESLRSALAEAARRGRPLGLLLLDLDRFKSVNDGYGHAVGDELLRRVGNLVASSCRGDEVGCRYGGEEIAVIVPIQSLESLVDRAESLRGGIGAIEIATPKGPLRRTVSVGAVFVTLPRGHTALEVVETADRALYRAKSEGRNRVIAARL